MLRQQYHILIIEDSPEDRAFLRRHLQSDPRYHYIITEAELAEQGLRLCQIHLPDAILLDFQLPDMDGLEFLAALHRMNAGMMVPVVMLTGHGTEAIAVQALKAGAQDYLVKEQITTASLSSALQQALEYVAIRRQLEQQHDELEQTNIALSQARNDLERRVAERTSELVTTVAQLQREIVERVQTEQALRASEAKLRMLMAQMPSILWTTDTDLRVTSVFGTGLPWLDHTDNLTEHLVEWFGIEGTNLSAIDAHRRALRGQADGYEHTVADRVFDVRVEPLRDHQNQITGCLGLALDITERKHTEQRLAFQANMLAQVQDAIIATDMSGRITYWNQGAEQLYRVSRGAAIGQSLRKLITYRWLSRADRQAAYAALAHGGAWYGEMIHRRKTGEARHVTTSVSVLYDERGRMIGILSLVRDITEHRQLEAQLHQSQKMEAIGRLAGGIAHDFNNLLMVIMSYSELLLDDIDPQHPCRHDVEEILHATRRATALTRQLLAFSRKQVLQPEIINLNTVVIDTDKLLRRLIGEDVMLLTILEPELRLVKVDPGQIEQVIMNLAINARDAMPEGGTLTIRTANIDLDWRDPDRHIPVPAGPYVLLEVRDTGIGMDAQTQAHLFEPFFTTKEPGKGTGLGLSTVYGIVKQSQGSIHVESAPGQGTTVTIYLPCTSETVAVHTPHPQSTALPNGTETILLVEDDPAVRTLIRQVLQARGYTVLEASYGQEALSMAEHYQQPIHLLLTDMVMPEMNGRELARQLARICPTLRVLYISGYADSQRIPQDLSESGVAFLQKPVMPDTLIRQVRALLDLDAEEGKIYDSGL